MLQIFHLTSVCIDFLSFFFLKQALIWSFRALTTSDSYLNSDTVKYISLVYHWDALSN